MSAAGDAVYVTAGGSADDHTKHNVYHYNTSTDHWTLLPRPGHCFGVLHMLDDKLTIFGGQDSITYYASNKVTTYNNSIVITGLDTILICRRKDFCQE